MTKRSHKDSHAHNKTSTLLVVVLVLIFMLPILVSTQRPQFNDNDEQYFRSLGFAFKQDQNHSYYDNLFSEFNYINVTSRVYIKESSIKQTELSTQSTTLILQADYLKMYKNKLSFKLSFNITPQILTAIKANLTFIETAFYFIKDNKNYLIEKQIIPFLAEFTHEWREGLQYFMLADVDLLQNKTPEVMVLNQMDVYFFQINDELLFTNTFEGSQAFGVVQVQLSNNKATDYYYPRPLATKINSKLKQNYIPLSTLEYNLNKNSKHQIKVNIRIGSYLFPYMMHTFETLNQGAEHLTFQIQGMQFGINDTLDVAEPFIIRYFKKVLFQGSFIGWTFLILQTFITLSSKVFSFIATFFQLQIFRNPIAYRGMSLYSILTFTVIDLLLIVVSFGYLRKGDFFGPLVSFVIGIWKIKKMGRLTMTWDFPFVEFDPEPWYEVYNEKDKQSLIKSFGPSLVFILVVMGYPLVFQGYLISSQQTDESLMQYIIHRFILTINEYRFMLGIPIQIILNYELESCNSLPWRYLIALLLFFSVDNSLLPVTTSLWEFLFFLKQEMLIIVLIFQKMAYGNSLNLLPYEEIRGNNQYLFTNRVQTQQLNQQKEVQQGNLNLEREEMIKLDEKTKSPENQSQINVEKQKEQGTREILEQNEAVQNLQLKNSSQSLSTIKKEKLS